MHLNSTLVNASCNFDSPNGDFASDAFITGVITFIPNYNLSFNSIWCAVSMKVGSKNNSIHTKFLKKEEGKLRLNQTTWMRNQSYSYPFTFNPVSSLSYQGINFYIKWEVSFVIELAINSLDIVKRIAAQQKNVQQQVLPSKHIELIFPFQIINTAKKYQLTTKNFNTNLTNRLLGYYLTASLSLIGIIASMVNHLSFIFLEILGSSTLGIGIYQTFVSVKKLGHIMWFIEACTTNEFFFHLEIGRNWSSIDRIEVACLVSEKGKKNAPLHRHNTTLSPIIKPIMTTRIPFPPLSKRIPPKLSTTFFSIEWKLEVIIFLKNQKKYQFEQIIEVDW